MSARMRTYGELAQVLGDVPRLIRSERRRQGLSLRRAGEQMGMPSTTLTQIENGGNYLVSNLDLILGWLHDSQQQQTAVANEGDTTDSGGGGQPRLDLVAGVGDEGVPGDGQPDPDRATDSRSA